MTTYRESRRLRERSLLALPVSIHGREYDQTEWNEVSQIIDATPFGARLAVSRPVGRGRLLQLELEMPRQLRCFDHTEPQYRTWALVRHLRQVEAAEHSKPFEIGVAFIGKHPPITGKSNPEVEYDIDSRPTDESLWGVRPNTPNEVAHDAERRIEPRAAIATEVLIEVYDAEGRVSGSEAVQTENISRRGMAVISELNLVRGRYVRVKSQEYNIAIIAAVRRLRRGADGKKHLHLEFVDQDWPPLDG